VFSEQEKALLALTEEVTLIQGRVSDETWANARLFWDEAALAAVLMAIITINAWNRIGVATEMVPAEHSAD
jgi:alkylhydroperoxidase family enzyme